MEKKITYYDILEITEDASAEDIRQAYRKLIKIWHPDLHPDDEKAALKTQEINEAYEVLIDPIKKSRYDAYLSLRKSFNSPDNPDSNPMAYSDEVHYEEMTFYEYTENVASETYVAYRDSKINNSPKTDKDSSVTWRIPERNELKQLRKAMFKKAVRVMLSSIFMSCFVGLAVWIRNLEIDLIAIVLLSIFVSLPVIIYFYFYRSALIFGERYTFDDELERRCLNQFLWLAFNFVPLVPLFMCVADKMGVVGYILIMAMSILTYWKELFMLILFVMGKYTIKEGNVYYANKETKISGSSYRYLFFLLVYLLEFEDEANRKIPVMVDRYTFSKFNEKGKAILINYKYGESYMFEIIRLDGL